MHLLIIHRFKVTQRFSVIEEKNEKEQSVTVLVLSTVLHVSEHSEVFFKELFPMKVSLPC